MLSRNLYRRGLFATLTMTIAVLGLVGLFNWLVDPYMVFGNNRFGGIYISGEREMKMYLVRNSSHQALLIGSSKMAHTDPGSIRGYRFLNVSFSNAQPEEIYWYIRKFAGAEKLIVIGLDLAMFNANNVGFRDDVDFPSTSLLARLRDYGISWPVAMSSFDTLMAVYSGQPTTINANGQRNTRMQDARHLAGDCGNIGGIVSRFVERRFGNFAYSERRIGILKKLKLLLDRKGIRAVVVISPERKEALALLRRMPAWHYVARLRRDLFAIFPDAVDLLESRYSEPDEFYCFDPVHYRPEAARRFVNEAVCRAGVKAACAIDNVAKATAPSP